MTYSYICEEDHITEVKMSITSTIPQTVECSQCKASAHRNWKDSTIHIPDYMKSCSETNKDNGANLGYLKDRMKYRPSGKQKIFWQGGTSK